eukprot:Unigene1737_Nuclearia_a/m.5338 Unigene1737_Nuclearia_a/g.5338  ORF Unigene1737_Nuclearia_a/g.5338 Unigene1737_Nuclearia_a/m.5338 type:complete len:322 (+) Unigene1737_Nuclearia_a:323-1288(+)
MRNAERLLSGEMVNWKPVSGRCTLTMRSFCSSSSSSVVSRCCCCCDDGPAIDTTRSRWPVLELPALDVSISAPAKEAREARLDVVAELLVCVVIARPRMLLLSKVADEAGEAATGEGTKTSPSPKLEWAGLATTGEPKVMLVPDEDERESVEISERRLLGAGAAEPPPSVPEPVLAAALPMMPPTERRMVSERTSPCESVSMTIQRRQRSTGWSLMHRSWSNTRRPSVCAYERSSTRSMRKRPSRPSPMSRPGRTASDMPKPVGGRWTWTRRSVPLLSQRRRTVTQPGCVKSMSDTSVGVRVEMSWPLTATTRSSSVRPSL